MVVAMKRVLCVLGFFVLILTGCSKQPIVNVDTLQRVFKNADPASQRLVEQVATSVKAKNYPNVMATLQKLTHQPSLTTDQERAIREAMTATQEIMTAPVKKPSS
jgi:hypothetical protein